jgi:hypothetical protein
MEQPMKLDADDRLEYKNGHCRVRIYRHHHPLPQSSPTAVVLVTNWDRETPLLGGAERALAVAIQDAYRIEIFGAERTALIVRCDALVWTINGHVLCETWDRLTIDVGTSRSEMSRADVVRLTGHPLNDPITQYVNPIDHLRTLGVEVPEEHQAEVLQEFADIARDMDAIPPEWTGGDC